MIVRQTAPTHRVPEAELISLLFLPDKTSISWASVKGRPLRICSMATSDAMCHKITFLWRIGDSSACIKQSSEGYHVRNLSLVWRLHSLIQVTQINKWYWFSYLVILLYKGSKYVHPKHYLFLRSCLFFLQIFQLNMHGMNGSSSTIYSIHYKKLTALRRICTLQISSFLI